MGLFSITLYIHNVLLLSISVFYIRKCIVCFRQKSDGRQYFLQAYVILFSHIHVYTHIHIYIHSDAECVAKGLQGEDGRDTGKRERKGRLLLQGPFSWRPVRISVWRQTPDARRRSHPLIPFHARATSRYIFATSLLYYTNEFLLFRMTNDFHYIYIFIYILYMQIRKKRVIGRLNIYGPPSIQSRKPFTPDYRFYTLRYYCFIPDSTAEITCSYTAW